MGQDGRGCVRICKEGRGCVRMRKTFGSCLTVNKNQKRKHSTSKLNIRFQVAETFPYNVARLNFAKSNSHGEIMI